MLQQVWLGGLGACPLTGVLHVLILASAPMLFSPFFLLWEAFTISRVGW